MRSIAIVLAAIAAAVALPAAAFAQDDAPPANGKKTPVEARAAAVELAKTRVQAMKDLPALLQQSGVTCTLSNGADKGGGDTVVNGKKVKTKFYEAACSEGLGYIVISQAGGTPTAHDCLVMNQAQAEGKSGIKCELPENADPAKSLQPLIAKAGAPSCTVSQAHWIGSSVADKVDQYEVGCADGSAFILVSPQPGSTKQLVSESCMTADLSGTECKYLPKATAIATITQLAASANRPACQVTDARYMGESPSHEIFYEVACADQKSGYVLQTDASGHYKTAIDCGRASMIGGGCNLTSVDMAETSENGTYTKAAAQISFPCNVTKYHSFGVEQASQREIVELVCSGRTDSVIAMLPTDKGQSGEVWNCARAATRSLKCSLAPMTATYAAMSQQVSGKGKSCQVSDARGVGANDKGSDFVEVACSGQPGMMIEYGPGIESVKSVMSCAEAKGIGGGCKLK